MPGLTEEQKARIVDIVNAHKMSRGEEPDFTLDHIKEVNHRIDTVRQLLIDPERPQEVMHLREVTTLWRFQSLVSKISVGASGLAIVFALTGVGFWGASTIKQATGLSKAYPDYAALSNISVGASALSVAIGGLGLALNLGIDLAAGQFKKDEEETEEDTEED